MSESKAKEFGVIVAATAVGVLVADVVVAGVRGVIGYFFKKT